jgi:opacity protein-like surface antigen
MHRHLALVTAILAISLPLWAQPAEVTNPRIDIFGGYSHIGNYGIGLNGWIASATWNLSRYVGVEGDVSGNYGSHSMGELALILPNLPKSLSSHMHSFNVGPNVTYRPKTSSKYDAFGHLLFGTSHTNVDAAGVGEGSTTFSWVLGGGGDYNFSPDWSARAQLDYMHTNFFSVGNHHGRYALGLVYHFGK